MLKFHREGPATNGATLSFLFRYIYLKLEFFIYIYDLQDAMETHASQIKGLLFFYHHARNNHHCVFRKPTKEEMSSVFLTAAGKPLDNTHGQKQKYSHKTFGHQHAFLTTFHTIG